MSNNQLTIDGNVAPGFESVRALFEHNMQTLEERNTQLCVYYQGQQVVDLWATAISDADFTPDSLINIFSSGKSLESIAVASLVGKGLLDYKAKLTDYWPEFGAQGKGELTVAELMRHEAGLAALNVSIEPTDLLTDNIKQNKIGIIIENHPQKFREGGSKREYHAVTRGWIVNELFRRVDSAGRTIGEYLKEEISQPLQVEAIVGVKQSDLGRRSKVVPLSFGFQFIQSLIPKFLGRRMEQNIFQIIYKLLKLLPGMSKGTGRGAPTPFKGMKEIAFFNDPSVAMGETPSANTNSNARSLAKIAAMMSMGGKWQDQAYMTDEAWQDLHGDPIKRDMGFMTTVFTQGGIDQFTDTNASSPKLERAFNSGREGFFGWMGLGGSIFQWHPKHQIGFGYVPTSLNVLDLFNERGKTYQAEVLRCVSKLTT